MISAIILTLFISSVAKGQSDYENENLKGIVKSIHIFKIDKNPTTLEFLKSQGLIDLDSGAKEAIRNLDGEKKDSSILVSNEWYRVFSEGGKIQYRIDFDFQGEKFRDSTAFHYDSIGRLNDFEGINKDGKLEFYASYSYNSLGQISRYRFVSDFGSYETKWFYYPSGEIAQKIHFDEGKFEKIESFFYSYDSLLKKKLVFYDDTSSPWSRVFSESYRYDSKKRLIEKVKEFQDKYQWDEDGDLRYYEKREYYSKKIWKYSYGEDWKRTDFFLDDDFRNWTSIEYFDSSGLVIKRESWRINPEKKRFYHCKYFYDIKGNWIRKDSFNDEGIFEREWRLIEYYD